MKYMDKDCTLIRRRASKEHRCAGNGAGGEYRQYALGCSRVIKIGESHVEYVGETPAFQSGSRHCMACYSAFLPSTPPP